LFHELVCKRAQILLAVCRFHKHMNAKDVSICRYLLLILLVGSFAVSLRGAQLVQWNFNSNPPDETNNFPTGSLLPSSGVGTAALVGTTSTFASGTGSTDPATIDDSGWNTAGYPSRTSGNKTRGVQFNVSTIGFERIVITWDQRNSDGAGRYSRFQYSTNGVDFIDGLVFNALRSTPNQERFEGRSVDLSSVPIVNNKADFAFRIVGEFESTATGAGEDAYLSTVAGGTYSTAGTWRFDMVTVNGEVFSGNEFPSISSITNQAIRMDTLSPQWPFTIGDKETAAENLNVSATSSDLALLPNENIFLAGSASNRTVQVLPAGGQSGNVTVTVIVTDEIGNATTTSFIVTVLPNNTPPTISSFTNYHSVASTPLAPIAFTVGDTETAAGSLAVSATSSNPTLIPDANVVPGGSGADRTLTITPAPQQIGNTVITVTVSDGELSTNRQFAVTVVPSTNVVLFEPFEYPDGSVNATSGFRWSNHSGIAGQTQVTAGELQLSSAQTEDISSVFIGAPYASDSGRTLYSAFTVNFKTLPVIPGEYFAHFLPTGGGSSFRARLYATTIDAALGSYRLAIANVANSVSNAVAFPLDLSLDVEYLVVVRYDIASAVSTLWVNPSSESDASATASDTAAPISINAWAFRQSAANGNMGTVHIDDLTVGFSFADVLPGYRLTIARNGLNLEISWPAAATDESYFLESTSDLSAPSWATVTAVPIRNGATDTVTVISPAGSRFYRLVK
jgi:hypothetical protein